VNSSLLSFCVSDAQLIAGFNGDVKRDWGASPTSTRSVCLDTDTARTVTLALNFDLIFSSLINSIQKQEKSALGSLKSSQEHDKTDEISMTLWYSVLQVVLYPLLGLIMRGICYGSFLQEVVQIVD
jgi:hypothetical protein